MAKQKKCYFQLKDQCGENARKEPLHGHTQMGDSGMLEIYVEGYGERDAEDGEGSIVQIEVWEGTLRVLVRPNINCPDPVSVDMEMAKESGRREIPE